MEWSESTPKYGDIIRTKVSFYYHYGIFADETNIIQFGLPNDPGRPSQDIKVLSSDIDAFLQGGELEVGVPSREERRTMRSPQEIVLIATSRIGEGGYDILHNNCEHFVNECAFGKSTSSFLDNVREKIRSKLKSDR